MLISAKYDEVNSQIKIEKLRVEQNWLEIAREGKFIWFFFLDLRKDR